MHLAEAPVRIQLRGSSTAGSGPDLTGYPHLTYAPSQWGEGVRVARTGAEVEYLARDLSELDRRPRENGGDRGHYLGRDDRCPALRPS